VDVVNGCPLLARVCVLQTLLVVCQGGSCKFKIDKDGEVDITPQLFQLMQFITRIFTSSVETAVQILFLVARVSLCHINNIAGKLSVQTDIGFRISVLNFGPEHRSLSQQEARLSLTNRATLFCKVVEVLQDFLSENVDKKFTTDYNVAYVAQWDR